VRKAVLRFGTGHMQMYGKFGKIFGRCLDDFWLGNACGLDVAKFDRELVQSGGKLLEAVKAKWGRDGAAVIRRLLPQRAVKKRSK